MTVFSTRISCFDATWNPTFGCDHVSPGCDHCYAEVIANRFHGGFALRLKPHRLGDAARFKPVATPEGPRPAIVFVNSMSDLWHADVPDAYLDQVFDAVEANPRAVFVCLTKRAPRMARYCAARWGGRGVPDHVWLGVSVEGAAQGGRLDHLRRLRRDVGPFTALGCLEPLIASPEGLDLSGLDWVICGGESGARARRPDVAWMRWVRDACAASGVPLWLKAWGHWRHNPLWPQALGRTLKDRRLDLVARGLELADDEQGGATLDGRLHRAHPAAYARRTEMLRRAMVS